MSRKMYAATLMNSGTAVRGQGLLPGAVIMGGAGGGALGMSETLWFS